MTGNPFLDLLLQIINLLGLGDDIRELIIAIGGLLGL